MLALEKIQYLHSKNGANFKNGGKILYLEIPKKWYWGHSLEILIFKESFSPERKKEKKNWVCF